MSIRARRVFITGGASGLGRALATALSRDGAKVLIGDVEVEAAITAANEIGASAIECDVRDCASLQRAAEWTQEQWGGVDLLINNAGVAHTGPIGDSSIDDWQWIVDINLLGVVRGTQPFLPQLRESRGTLLNIASMAGVMFLPDAASYNATKAAVVALSETLMLELEPDGVDVHVACPAFFRTALARNMRTTDESSKALTRRLVERAKLGADEVARTILTRMAQGDQIIFTHPKSRNTWRMKRLLPLSAFQRLLRKQLDSMSQRMNREKSPK